MEEIKLNLIAQAQNTYKTIYPCGTKSTFGECFTAYRNKILFWFDTEDHSTHLITAELAVAA